MARGVRVLHAPLGASHTALVSGSRTGVIVVVFLPRYVDLGGMRCKRAYGFHRGIGATPWLISRLVFDAHLVCVCVISARFVF